MHPDTLLFRYSVKAQYMGKGTYPVACGSLVDAVLSFNFDTGLIRLSAKTPQQPFTFVYSTWESFESEWNVLEREASPAGRLL